jgi:hypothetical protein
LKKGDNRAFRTVFVLAVLLEVWLMDRGKQEYRWPIGQQ